MTNHSEPYKLLIGTNQGVYQAPVDNLDEAKQILETKHVLRINAFGNKIFAATRSGLFRSTDHGEKWVNLNLPRQEAYSVYLDGQNNKLYAGTHPAHLYVSDDLGETWNELKGLQKLPSRNTWHTPRHRNEAHVRSLGGHEDMPGRLIAGIEVGGVHVSEDGGETWTERRDGLHDDIHHVLITEADEYIASTGGGLYRTRNAGRTWSRLDNDLDHHYFREAFAAGGQLYAAAARSAPPAWGGEYGADAALFESTDGGNTFHSAAYPGQPKDFVLAWTAVNETVYAGTLNGHILRKSVDGWIKTASIPSAIRSLALI